MHVAAAVGAPTVGIFALQSDEPERWAPLGARVAVVRTVVPVPAVAPQGDMPRLRLRARSSTSPRSCARSTDCSYGPKNAADLRLTIQLCTYNRARLLERVLEALFDQTLPDDAYEVVLVNDGSPRRHVGGHRARAPAGALRVHRDRAAERRARAGAQRRHRAVARRAHLFIDDDVLPTPVFAAEHLASDERHGDVIVRGAVINTASFDDAAAAGVDAGELQRQLLLDEQRLAAPRATGRAGGRFDESFTEYGWEDIELGMRLRALGTRAVFNRYAVAFHYKPPRGPAIWRRSCGKCARRRARRCSCAPSTRTGGSIWRSATTPPQRGWAPRCTRSGIARARRARCSPRDCDALSTSCRRAARAKERAWSVDRILLSRIGPRRRSHPVDAGDRDDSARVSARAHVTIVVQRYNAVVVERSPDVDAVVRIAAGERPAALRRAFRGVDLAIALAPNAADMRLVGATRAPRRIGYTYARRYLTRLVARRWLTDLLVSNADPAICERRRAAAS